MLLHVPQAPVAAAVSGPKLLPTTSQFSNCHRCLKLLHEHRCVGLCLMT